jgi:anthranilate synthase component 2
MILLIDNYDSFTYNLYQLIAGVAAKFDSKASIKVVRNDKITIPDIEKLAPSHIFISPGPGKPSDAGVSIAAIKAFKGVFPIFGVCLGHQAIWEAYGGTVGYAKKLCHGKQSAITITGDSVLFKGFPEHFPAARYHSLSAQNEALPGLRSLLVTAVSDDGEIMAIEDKAGGVYGVQFHPESVLTPAGGDIIKNFLEGTHHE